MTGGMSSVTTLQLGFDERWEGNLDLINRLLAAMELSDVELTEYDGYLARKRLYREGREVVSYFWPGLDRVKLICRQEYGKPVFRWQVELGILEDAGNRDELVRRWQQKHPECRVYCVRSFPNDGHIVFAAVYGSPVQDGAAT